MFYTGKSTACHTCRQRRLKCDEARPHCQKCMRAGRECKGYRDDTAFIIRDMTSATIQKFTKEKSPPPSPDGDNRSHPAASSRPERTKALPDRSRTGLASPPSTTSQGPRDNQVTSRRASTPRSRRSRALEVGTLSLPVEDQALCYFANRYALAPTQYLDPGYLSVLKLVSHKKSVGPCLSNSLSAVSLAAFSTRPNARKTVVRARAAYSTALRLTNEAIQQPHSCHDDELLASVVLLALFEVFTSESILGWCSHVYGAAAMLGARGKVSIHDKFCRALFRVISNESVKLALMGFSSPHSGTESWLQWLSNPTYTTYITPDAAAAEPAEVEDATTIELKGPGDFQSLTETMSLKGTDAIDQARTGRDGTLPVPQLPNAPINPSGPRTDEEMTGLNQVLDDTKEFIQAYEKYQRPIPSSAAQDQASIPLIDSQAAFANVQVSRMERSYEMLAETSLHICGCVARLVTYNVMARCAASIPHQATQEYAEAVSMGRKEIAEILRLVPYFYGLMEETDWMNSASSRQPVFPDDEPSSSDSSETAGERDVGTWMSKRRARLPLLAKSYIGFMILWPISTAATTDLVDAQQFETISTMQKYITEACGIRMAEGVRQFCLEKRKFSDAPFWA
ncbi:hypothetical protein JX265_011245 [Neoarthrinium moseri]|uniref:Zn(2)-C6 fungal-type domain-containing protein n=1 Tax=Neoarthrinium moseri TaxID=1658444 RepID=A0A9P9WD40_9PEZI|nr:hypothetical protein JX266_007947 [Neoarthrinium moseri]KAI1857510.1 hypothetical protein JX265_011245 [Neoarthrinium moseri]